MLHEKGEIGKKKDTKQKVYTGGTTVKEEGGQRSRELQINVLPQSHFGSEGQIQHALVSLLWGKPSCVSTIIGLTRKYQEFYCTLSLNSFDRERQNVFVAQYVVLNTDSISTYTVFLSPFAFFFIYFSPYFLLISKIKKEEKLRLI